MRLFLFFLALFVSECCVSNVISFTEDEPTNSELTKQVLGYLFKEQDSDNDFIVASNQHKFNVRITSQPLVLKNYKRHFKLLTNHIAEGNSPIDSLFKTNFFTFKKNQDASIELTINQYKSNKSITLTYSTYVVAPIPVDSFGVSIVIPTFNRLNECVTCVHMLKSCIRAPKENWEVIVVADGCTDGTGTYLTELFTKFEGFENFRVIWTDKKPGVYRNAGWPENSGVRAAKFSHIALCDCDVYHLSDPVSPTLKLFRENPNRVVVGHLHCVSSPNSVMFAESTKYCLEEFKWNHRCEPGWFSVCRQTYIDIGGSSEELMNWGFEDEDLINRFQKMNVEKVRADEIICTWRHEVNATHKDNWKEKWEANQAKIKDAQSVNRNETKPNWGLYSDKPIHQEGKVLFSKGL